MVVKPNAFIFWVSFLDSRNFAIIIIQFAQDRDRWQALVNAVRNLWVPQNAGNFLTS
jgi:hypothetical protein